MKAKAKFIDGDPANLPAAAMDALEWLLWFQKYSARHPIFSLSDSKERLAGAIQNLERQLEPHLPEEYQQKVESSQ